MPKKYNIEFQIPDSLIWQFDRLFEIADRGIIVQAVSSDNGNTGLALHVADPCIRSGKMHTRTEDAILSAIDGEANRLQVSGTNEAEFTGNVLRNIAELFRKAINDER
jgi:hypothetical protein